VKTTERPELREPVRAFAARLAGGERRIPLADLAALFGAGEDVLARVRRRGDLVFTETAFSNDGPELTVPAGKVELEIPSLVRGEWGAGPSGFRLSFPMAEFTLRACVTVAIVRKCFELRELRATDHDLVLDFGSALADRRYSF
jgi:hypothetical protein